MNRAPGMEVRPPAPIRRGVLRHDDSGLDLAYAFNPTLFESEKGLTVLLRAVDTKGARRVFRYATDRSLNPSSTLTDWTAEIRQLSAYTKWVADPRPFRLRGRWYITFNSGHSERPNNIYIVEIDEAGRPVASPKAVVLEGLRRSIEKNWGFFEYDETLYAIYSLAPLVVLECRFRDDRLLCRPVYRHAWMAGHLETAFGPLHGGTSPVLVGDRMVSAFQSRVRTDGGFVYTGNLIAIEAQPPFRPLASGTRPLFTLAPDEQAMQSTNKLNDRVAQCLYPSGLVADADKQRLILTYGINDYRCGYRYYKVDELDAHLLPVTIHAGSGRKATTMLSASENIAEGRAQTLLRSFYWKPPRTDSPSPEALTAARFQLGNFGDSMQCHINAALFGALTHHIDAEGCRLLGAGSIAHRARRGDIIWGSGFKEIPLPLSREDKDTIEVRAVRGPLTADYLSRNGVDTSCISQFFDPGILIGEIFADQIARCRTLAGKPAGILLIPHYKDTHRFHTSFSGRYRMMSVDCDLFEMATAVLGAELVISTSLHGIILAEALGIPAILMTPPSSEPFTKYQDYYSGTLRDRFPVIDQPKDAAGARIPETPRIPRNWRDSLPDPTDLLARGIAVQAHSLNAPQGAQGTVAMPGISEMYFDIGRYSGDSFLLDIEMAYGSAKRLRIADRSSTIYDLPLEAHKRIITLELDGEAIEANGNLISVSLAAEDGSTPISSHKVSARTL